MTHDPRKEVDDELAFHLEQRTRDYIARGMSPEAARAAATRRFGDAARVRDVCASALAAERAAEARRARLPVSWLDVKLGIRMLAKYPGLSLVSVLGMAVAIAISAGYYLLAGAMLDSRLPFDEDGRVVVIRMNAVGGSAGDGLPSLDDFERWRQELTSIADLGAFRDDSRNLTLPYGDPAAGTHLVQVASITASGLRLTGAAPVLGRTLTADDERASSPPVVLIAYEDWRRRFDADPAVLGRIVGLDGSPHTIVGVMPEGFGFPIDHQYWVPLRAAAAGPTADGAVHVFGRIAHGYSLRDARAELSLEGERMAAARPETHAHLRPHVQPYTAAFIGVEGPGAQAGIRALQFGVSLLLLVVAVNVSILVYARTATRVGEIAVRTALGASRGRVVAQMVIEALVPALASAALGLGLLSVALRPFRQYLRDSPTDVVPYWFGGAPLAVSFEVALYAVALAVFAAVITGALPALKATGRRVQSRLQQFSSRGAGLRLGGTWTALIVLQVAVTVAVLPAAVYKTARAYQTGLREPSAVAAPLLRGTLEIPADAALRAGRLAEVLAAFEAEPAVAAVTVADRFPGEEPAVFVEVEGAGAESTHMRAQPNRVSTNFFDLFGVPVLAGRAFSPSDFAPAADAIVVDQAFADRLGGGSVLGRRIRFANGLRDGRSRESPWMEVVGVVPAFTASIVPPVAYRDPLPRLYLAGGPGDIHPATVILRVNAGDPAHLSQRVRQITAAVDPTLKLHRLAGVIPEIDRERRVLRGIAFGVLAVTASVLLLSAAGIYAMMSFTVARRRREIGIRTALGADARRVLIGIFGRAGAQIAAGVLLGLTVAAALEWGAGAEATGGQPHLYLPAVAVLMLTVGLLAALGPARRGLAVQPIEALRAE